MMNSKKILAALSAAVMGMTILPLSSFAADTQTAAEEEYSLPVLPAEYSITDRLDEAWASIDGTFLANSKADTCIALMRANLERFYGDTYVQKFSAMDAAANRIVAGIDPSLSDLSKIIYVNDYLTLNCAYDTDYRNYTAYDCIVLGDSVCQGYAEAFWYLMYKMDIECKIVTSSQKNHAWNIVMVDGQWYQIDVTWNDPVPDKEGRSRHVYLLESEEKFRSPSVSGHSSHDATDWTLYYEDKSSANGYASSTKFDNYFWKNVDVPLIINNDKYYFVDKKQKYIGYADASNNIKKLKDMTFVTWPVVDNPNSFWIGYFSGLKSYNNKLIYNGPNDVYSCNFDGTEVETVYTLSSEELKKGRIYGLLLNGNKLTMLLSPSPSCTISEKLTITLKGGSAPSAPTVTSVTPAENCVTLKWNAVDGADSYRVQYRVNGTTKWSYKNTTQTAMKLTDLNGGTKYQFLVRAYNGSDWSAYTNADIVTATPTAPALKPKFTSVTPGVNSISLKWNAINGATSYRVHYRLSGSGKWSYVNTKRTSLTLSNLTGEKKYDLVVRYSNGTVLSSFTSADIVTATPLTAFVKPKFTSVTPGVNSISLKWNAVDGATSYRVHYRLSGSGKWSYVNTKRTSLTLSNLTGGKKYDLVVRYSNGTVLSSFTSADIVTATPLTAFVKPKFTSVTPGVNSISLKWNAVDGATSYRVHYRLSGSGKWSYVNTKRTSLTLTDLTGGKKYDLVVRYSNGTVLSSFTSADIVTATPKTSDA